MISLRVTVTAVCCAGALAGCGLVDQAHKQVGAQAWPGCDTFPAQEAAQKAWELAGRPDINGSSDGEVCEQLPSLKDATDVAQGRKDPGQPGDKDEAKRTGCRTSKRPVVVLLSRSKYPETTLNFETAVKHGIGPTFHIDRTRDDANRDAWQSLVPESLDTDGDGQVEDRDEWPPASSTEASRRSSSGRSLSQIAFVDPSDNRGAGSVMGGRLRPYCDGTPFTIKPYNRRLKPTQIVVAARGGERVRERVSADR